METYRDFEIEFYDPANYYANGGYLYTHMNYDGPEDDRCGYEKTVAECKLAIDAWWREQVLDADNRQALEFPTATSPASASDDEVARAKSEEFERLFSHRKIIEPKKESFAEMVARKSASAEAFNRSIELSERALEAAYAQGRAEGMAEAAKIANNHSEGRMRQARASTNRTEARDFTSMSMAAYQIEMEIRATLTPPESANEE